MRNMKCDGEHSKRHMLDVCWKPLQRNMRQSIIVMGHMQHLAMALDNACHRAPVKYVVLVQIALGTCQVNRGR